MIDSTLKMALTLKHGGAEGVQMVSNKVIKLTRLRDSAADAQHQGQGNEASLHDV